MSGGRAWWSLLAVGVVVAAVLVARGPLRSRARPVLPPELVETETVEDLSQNLGAWTLRPGDGGPIEVRTLQPGHEYVVNRGPRPAFVAPPGSELRLRRRLPAGATLAFGITVQGRGVRDTTAAGVRFEVARDGEVVFSRTLNPAAHRHDRTWVDERVDLALTAERDVELTLRTTADGHGTIAGTPGWNHVRVLRDIRRPRQHAAPDAPNVLVLLVDTLRADALGCYGAAPSPSPSLDALAHGGMRFEQAIAQASWTLPSVASVLTGLHPRSHGATGSDDGDPVGGARSYLPDAVTTLAELASRAGITTVAVSTNPLISRGTNYAQGFETFVEFGLLKDAEGRNNWTPASDVNRIFLDWLAANASYRFFGYLHYMEPHHPYTPGPAHMPPSIAGIRSEVADGDLSEFRKALFSPEGLQLPEPEVRYLRSLYDAEVANWDDALAGLLAGLDRVGVRDRTILIVTADHGEEFQEHARLGHGCHLYDELLHVPLVIAGPGVAPAVRTDQVQGIDVFPTVTARLQLAPPGDLPGHDLFDPVAPRPVVSEISYGVLPDKRTSGLVSVRTPDWKLIAASDVPSVQLYHLARDHGETRDQYGEAAEAAVLEATLESFRQNAKPAPAAAGSDPAVAAKLRALGYAE
jgi:arylsulfatase